MTHAEEVMAMGEPAGDYFLVELDPEPDEMRGRIVLPERHRRFAHRIGTVRKCGPTAGDQVYPGLRIIVSDHAYSISKDEHDKSMRLCTLLDVQFFVPAK